LHVLDFSSESARLPASKQLVSLDVDWQRLSVERHVAFAQEQVREFYPEFVYRFAREKKLGGRTMLELLRWKRGPNLWWLGETCEKSPLRHSPLIRQLYRLALLHGVLQTSSFDEVWLALGDRDFSACIEMAVAKVVGVVKSFSIGSPTSERRSNDKRFLVLLGRLVALRLRLVVSVAATRAILRYCEVTRLERAGGKLIGFYSRFPALWRNAYGESPIERYFGHVQQLLAGRTRVAFFVWLSDLRELWRRRATLRPLFARINVSPLVSYLRVSDILAVLFDTTVVRAYVRYHWRMASSVDVGFLRWNVSRLWDAELKRNLTGVEIPRNMLMFLAAKRFSSELELAALINPMEFQPMERAIWAGAERNTTRVGMQHGAYCRNFLMYLFGRGELDAYIRDRVPDASPLPDYVATTGMLAHDDLQRNGVPGDRIALCGAVRYNDLRFEERADNLHAASGARRREVLVLTSQLRDESLNLIGVVARAASECPDEYTFAFKNHYHCILEEEIDREFATQAPAASHRVLDVHGSVQDFIRRADAVVVGGTGAVLEVLAVGHLPLVYVEPTTLPLCPLTDLPRAYHPFSSANGLLHELRAATPPTDAVRQARRQAVEQLLFRLDGKADARFVAFLERVGAL
jgi:surface carbohydrate biosynthesis protein (TIGR04326 family)